MHTQARRTLVALGSKPAPGAPALAADASDRPLESRLVPRPKTIPAALLLVFVTAALLPLAASGTGPHGCHCPVRMACCENGTCTMSGSEPPATGPEWRTCRREAPASAAAPLDAFERALKNSFEGKRGAPPSGPLVEVFPPRLRAGAPIPATPPPRAPSF